MRRFVMLASVCLLAACKGDSATQPSPVYVIGNWSLRSLNGSPLPYLVDQTPTTKVELMAVNATFSAGSAFTTTAIYRYTRNGVVSPTVSPDTGTYELTGASIVVRFNDGTTISGSVTRGTMTLSGPSGAFVFVATPEF